MKITNVLVIMHFEVCWQNQRSRHKTPGTSSTDEFGKTLGLCAP